MFRLAILLLTVLAGTYGQEFDYWEDGCDPRAIELIEPISEAVDYTAACAIYQACTSGDDVTPPCQFRVLNYLMESCAPENAACRSRAMLYMVAMSIFDTDPFGESIMDEPGEGTIPGFPDGLAAFEAGNYAAALESFGLMPPSYSNPFPSIARAILYQHLNQPEMALEEYRHAENLLPNDVLLHYGRAHLYGSLGRNIEASVDVLWLQNTIDPDFAGLIAPLVEAYPVDENALQDWQVYPTISGGSGPAGSFFSDDTQASPTTIQLAFYDEADLLLTVGLEAKVRFFEDAENDILLIPFEGQQVVYRLPDPHMDGFITLTPLGDVIVVAGNMLYFEGASDRYFILVPVGADDPRDGLHGERCGVMSRLRRGMQARYNAYMESDNAFNAPNGDPVGSAWEITVLDESQCIDNRLWWKIRAEAFNENPAFVAWMPENDGSNYLINPANQSEESLFYCPDVLSPRLVVNGTGTVLQGFGIQNVRIEANTTADLVTQIPEGETFTVLGGPVCAGGLVWWQVEYQGETGWTAESDNGNYWLEPIIPTE